MTEVKEVSDTVPVRDSPGRRFRTRVGLIGLAVFVCAACGLTFFLGFEVGERKLFSYSLLQKVDRKLQHLIGSGRIESQSKPDTLQSRTYNSILILLESEVGTIDTSRRLTDDATSSRYIFQGASESGGGLTSFGSDVLLLPYDGLIYAAKSADSIRVTEVRAPDNNRSAYLAVADNPAFSEYTLHKGLLRYNDLAYVASSHFRALIASYIEFHPDRACYTNTLARLDIDPDVESIDEIRAQPEDWQVIFRTQPCLPFKSRYIGMEGTTAGGRIVFRAPSTIFLASGDFHHDGMRSDGPPIAQDPTAQYGKIIAIDLLTGADRIVSMGHRNPADITLWADGQPIIVEQGPRGGDELNLIREGENFGWPLESYGTTYGGTRIPGSVSYGRHDAQQKPIYAWVPSVATSSLTFVHDFHSAWDGDLLVGTLKDRSLHRVRLDENRVIYNERIEIGSRIRAVHQHTDGRLVLWTDNEELVFLSPRDRLNLEVSFEKFLDRASLPQPLANRLEATISRCAECHSFEVDDHQAAPSLARMYGNDIAASSYAGYSDALRNKKGRWTHESLTTFLADPQQFAPGTSMPRVQIADESVLDALVLFLEEVDRRF